MNINGFPWIVPVAVVAALLVAGLGGCSKTPEEKKALEAAHLAQTTGRLVVKSNRANTTIEATRIPSGGEAASASINGVAEGAAEHTLSALPAWKYAITARSEGWPEVHQEANIAAGGTAAVAINFKSGSLRLDSDPSGATVKQAGTELGKTPLVIPQLPAGESQLTFEYAAWPAVSLKVVIKEGTESAETVRLPHGRLTVTTFPAGAAVLLGKRSLGQTPLTLAQFPAGTSKLTLQAKDFPPMAFAVTVEDRGDVKVSPVLGAIFPGLDPAALLRSVWVPDDPNRIAPPFDGIQGPSKPKNDIIKNLNRKRLYEGWFRKRYGFTGTVKAYDPKTGQVEFAEQQSELSRYRVLASLTSEASTDPAVARQLTKGATFAVYGQLSAVEEPRWPFKVITFELSPADPLR
jgi:hypothetical protein